MENKSDRINSIKIALFDLTREISRLQAIGQQLSAELNKLEEDETKQKDVQPDDQVN